MAGGGANFGKAAAWPRVWRYLSETFGMNSPVYVEEVCREVIRISSTGEDNEKSRFTTKLWHTRITYCMFILGSV
jgi:hypothetical protein